MGCPSGTVTAKGKGSGMLRDPEFLDTFLDAIFSHCCLPISVKTRIGFCDAAEFPKLFDIYNRYPIRELTVHPRIRTAFYKGNVDMDMFHLCMEESKNPVCYTGDVTAPGQALALQQQYPGLDAVMIGGLRLQSSPTQPNIIFVAFKC